MHKIFVALLFSGCVLATPRVGQAKSHPAMDEMDMTGAANGAPVDIGFGPGRTGRAAPMTGASAAAKSPTWAASNYVLGYVSPGGPNAGATGVFDPPVSWPINGIHDILLPDGRVLNYGTTQKGAQGAALVYDIWTPSLGTGQNAHQMLPNTTTTDIFCSEQSMMWSTGQVLITGGDLTTAGMRNYSNNATTVFSPLTNTISSAASMAYPRWYPSMVAMPNGDMLVLGGRLAPATPATTPEVYNPVSGWRTLTGASSATAFANAGQSWFYPRAFLKSDGNVFMLDAFGFMWTANSQGAGATTKIQGRAPNGGYMFPSTLYAPDRLISLRLNATAVTVDFSGARPVSASAGSIDQQRYWSNLTVMADGSVFLSGGSAVANQLPADLTSMIWNPVTNTWTMGATAAVPRLYHSISLLLPDATVLTGGGGAPGPVNNLNAEIYYPPYLYLSDGSGNPAPRPTLVSAPSTAAVGQTIAAAVGGADVISRVTLVRFGSVTHTHNIDQRFIDAPFTQTGKALTVTLPANPNVMAPGGYMMFVHQNGVPSVSQTIVVTAY